jgi:TPR repeat protein
MQRPFGAFLGPLVVLIAAGISCAGARAADGDRPDDPSLAQRNPIAQLRRDAEHGNERAQYLLGCCYNGDRGLQRDPAEAAKWWGRAAEKGVADAQYCLGLSYSLGQGVPRDPAEAARWWRKAADQDHADAQYFLALSYCAGLGVPKSPPMASYWLSRSAGQGNKAAAELLRKIGLSPG